MRVRANVGMVMNLDKCIGCHTCSVTCKQVWTNRPGVEYVYFNNVETKPGIGYPKAYEDQERWKGGWELDRKGRLRLKGGGWMRKLATIFANPDLPSIDDYGEPWTYDYQTLFDAPVSAYDPVATAHSRMTGKRIDLQWGSNWEDNLGGASERAPGDPNLRGIEAKVQFEYEQAFMFYLPRICEHCLNPSCVASCPSGAMYKREEDGIVLVDQDKCRGWRFCVSGCPYKKVYFNHETGKAEKCTFCYPRVEAGQPTICSETCVGRLRYLGLILYDADQVEAAAATPEVVDLTEAQLGIFLDPEDPAVQAQARLDGIPEDWLVAARRSPIYALAMRYRVALPLHPEYRTLPMVWYVPPLSPLADVVDPGAAGADADDVFHAIDDLRIPVEYLANLLSAGDAAVIRTVLRRLTAVRATMREAQLGGRPDPGLARAVGLEPEDLLDLYQLLAVAKYEDRYVIPPAHTEAAERLAEVQTGCSVDYEGQFAATAQGYREGSAEIVGTSAADGVGAGEGHRPRGAAVEFIHLAPRGSVRPPAPSAGSGPRIAALGPEPPA
ncbi:MAG: nitrate reductase subunit beta [Chloroflexota bacterium]|nr:MAG: nitrate reductase subunit beta [Chloroflexota bacterium]